MKIKTVESLFFLILIIILFIVHVPIQTHAGTLLLSETAGSWDKGYNRSSWSNMTDALNTATGNQVTVISNFENLSQMLLFDALWLDHRGVGGSLSATEVSNISTFIDTGRRVVMFGENTAWTDWNNQLLSIVGSTFLGETKGVTSIVYANDLTASAPTIDLPLGGIASGGRSLYDINFATLWGTNSNVLTILDINIMDDNHWNLQSNAQFSANVANWAANATVVPEPVSSTLFIVGGATLGFRRFRKKVKK